MFENEYSNFEYGESSEMGYGQGGFGPSHSPEARKAERLFSKLAAEGRYADIDKAKHNEQYKKYLLENLDI